MGPMFLGDIRESFLEENDFWDNVWKINKTWVVKFEGTERGARQGE